MWNERISHASFHFIRQNDRKCSVKLHVCVWVQTLKIKIKKTHILIQTAFAQPFIHAHIKSLCAAALLSCTSSNLWLPELFSLLLPRAAVYSKMVPEEEAATDALKYTKQQTDTVWDEMPNIQESSAQWRAFSLFLCLPSARLRRRTTKAEETFDESKCSG